MFHNIIQLIKKKLSKLKTRWTKHRVETPKHRGHKKYIPAVKGTAVSKLKEVDLDANSYTPEYTRPEVGAVRTYYVRNPKTGTVVVMQGTLEQLKRSYPEHEVVPPQIQ